MSLVTQLVCKTGMKNLRYSHFLAHFFLLFFCASPFLEAGWGLCMACDDGPSSTASTACHAPVPATEHAASWLQAACCCEASACTGQLVPDDTALFTTPCSVEALTGPGQNTELGFSHSDRHHPTYRPIASLWHSPPPSASLPALFKLHRSLLI
jgi:hypothetical protein